MAIAAFSVFLGRRGEPSSPFPVPPSVAISPTTNAVSSSPTSVRQPFDGLPELMLCFGPAVVIGLAVVIASAFPSSWYASLRRPVRPSRFDDMLGFGGSTAVIGLGLPELMLGLRQFGLSELMLCSF